MEKWETIQPGPFEPTWESLRRYQCPDWFRDAKLGIWSHWGPQSVPMYGDWYATIGGCMGTPPGTAGKTWSSSGRRSALIRKG